MILAAVIIPLGIYLLRQTSPAFNFFFSPSDLYTPLIVKPFDISIKGNTFTVDFQNKYPGLHWFNFGVEKPFNPESPICAREYAVQISIFQNDTEVASKTVHAPCKEGFRDVPDENRFWYFSPQDLPLREPLKAVVTVQNPDADFAKHYGKVIFEIAKLSDE